MEVEQTLAPHPKHRRGVDEANVLGYLLETPPTLFKLAAIMATTGPGVPGVFANQCFASRLAPGHAFYPLGAPGPDLFPNNGVPIAPIWNEKQAKHIMTGISEVFMEHG